MGVFSGLKKGLKKAVRSFDEEFRDLGDEFARQKSDSIKFATLGLVDPKGMSKAKKAEARASREAKKLQAKQRRASILEGAELSDAIAHRSNIAKRGGRSLLTSAGRSGSLLS